jgi:NAD(P)-dependent dehydrogenase (short-subunit alcohol dehydrogenase family)
MMDELFEIRGRVALVTGGTSGIGRMIAQALVRRGVITYITGRDASRSREIASGMGPGRCIGLPADLAAPDGPARLAAEFARHEGQLHLLVNNAGANDDTRLEQLAPADWDHILNVNLRSAFFLVQQLLPALRSGATANDPARIVNIGSIGGLHVPDWDAFAYGASKAALHHLTRSLAKRLGKDHITVNAIAPGPFPSRMNDVGTDAMKRSIQAHIPLNRPGAAQDIEGVVVFLASRAGAYVNGATIPLDGGYLAAL